MGYLAANVQIWADIGIALVKVGSAFLLISHHIHGLVTQHWTWGGAKEDSSLWSHLLALSSQISTLKWISTSFLFVGLFVSNWQAPFGECLSWEIFNELRRFSHLCFADIFIDHRWILILSHAWLLKFVRWERSLAWVKDQAWCRVDETRDGQARLVIDVRGDALYASCWHPWQWGLRW